MDQIKIAILTQHLPYELDMFDEATAYLQSKEFEQSVNVTERGTAWFKKNAAIEVFWTHARNLIEFLIRTKSKSIDEMMFAASARDFAEEFRSELDADTLMGKINAQVSHLGFGRKTSPVEKLGSIDMNWVKPAIDSEIKRFESLLNSDCRDYWVTRHPIALVTPQPTHTTSATSMIVSMPRLPRS
jgi:hypothetical protein